MVGFMHGNPQVDVAWNVFLLVIVILMYNSCVYANNIQILSSVWFP